MKIVAVNGRHFSVDELQPRARGLDRRQAPLEFIVDNAGYFKTVSVPYQGGLRYPHLERAAGATDLLTAIAAPRAR